MRDELARLSNEIALRKQVVTRFVSGQFDARWAKVQKVKWMTGPLWEPAFSAMTYF